MFYSHAPLPDSIKSNDQYGIGGYEFVVRDTDPSQPQWGDGVNGVTCKRAQLVDQYRAPMESSYQAKLSIVIPGSWQFYDHPVSIGGLHGVSVPIDPVGIFVYGDTFWVHFNEPDATGNLPKGIEHRKTVPLIRDKVYEFDIDFFLSKQNRGYFSVMVNSNPLFTPKDFYGNTISPLETGLPYGTLGPYVFLPAGMTWWQSEFHVFMAFRPL